MQDGQITGISLQRLSGGSNVAIKVRNCPFGSACREFNEGITRVEVVMIFPYFLDSPQRVRARLSKLFEFILLWNWKILVTGLL
jgi:hypothetical protein